jgi:transposase-like protein
LHDQGYTFEAIREALAEVGVVVSRSTVHREVARLRLKAKPPATLGAASPPG